MPLITDTVPSHARCSRYGRTCRRNGAHGYIYARPHRVLLTFHSSYHLLPLQSAGEIKRREVSWTLTKSWTIICGSRRDQEEGGGAGPRRLLLPLFLNSCATDIVFVTLLCTAVETAISEVHKFLGSGEVPTSLTLLFWRWSLRVGAR